MSGYTEELFCFLVSQAYTIVSGELRGLDRASLQEITHDITINFIFFSKSYRETFDVTKDIEPFFHSYVRRCCLRYRDNITAQKKILRIDYMVINQCGVEDVGMQQFEVLEYARTLCEALVDKCYYARRHTLRLHDLFMLSLESFALFGKANTVWIAKQLEDCSSHIVKAGLEKMREVLRERIQNETQDFCGLLEGAD
jgi:hypothetical protein